MRIGIVTQPLANNYGGILQNWALQQVLKKMGHVPYTIKIRVGINDRLWAVRWLIHDIRSTVSFLKGEKDSFINPITYYRGPLCLFNKFVRKYIRATKCYDVCPSKVIPDYKLNALISGSDQVWRPMYNPNIEDEFLGFAKGYSVLKIAYAASFGTSDWEFSPELTQKCRALAKNLDAVSVREVSGVELCKEHFGIDATWVLDPTLLLDKSDYASICLPKQVKEPYIFAYILDGNAELKLRIEEEAKRRNCILIYKSADDSVDKSDSIEMWLSLIANAEMVFTDSFHGTIFSIIFERQFVTFVNKDRGSARFDTLRKLFNISDRIIDGSYVIPQSEVDYTEINKVITNERQRSINWLSKALKSTL